MEAKRRHEEMVRSVKRVDEKSSTSTRSPPPPGTTRYRETTPRKSSRLSRRTSCWTTRRTFCGRGSRDGELRGERERRRNRRSETASARGEEWRGEKKITRSRSSATGTTPRLGTVALEQYAPSMKYVSLRKYSSHSQAPTRRRRWLLCSTSGVTVTHDTPPTRGAPRRAAARLADGDAVRLDFLQFRRDMSDAARPRQHAVLPRAVGHARRRDERQERDGARVVVVVVFFFNRLAVAVHHSHGERRVVRRRVPRIRQVLRPELGPRRQRRAARVHVRENRAPPAFGIQARVRPVARGNLAVALGNRGNVDARARRSKHRSPRLCARERVPLLPLRVVRKRGPRAPALRGKGLLRRGRGGAARAPPPPPTTPRPRPGNTAPPTLERGTT